MTAWSSTAPCIAVRVGDVPGSYPMDAAAAAWFGRATSHWRDWDVDRSVAAKAGRLVSVVIAARDERATIGEIVAGIRRDLVEGPGLVDEIVVIDSDSLDDTARVAADAGAVVHAARTIRPDLDGFAGKGEAIWKSLFVTSGELLVFIDADLTGWGTHFVSGLLGPLLTDERVQHVKGFYDRVLDHTTPDDTTPDGTTPDDGSGAHTPQGGRVTELLARPLLNLRWPELAAVVQPLAGEWAIRRSTIEALPVPVGYGVELGLLVDVWAAGGPDALAQVDLGERAHAHQSVHDLGVMAAEILETADRRSGAAHRREGPAVLWQYTRDAQPPWRGRPVPCAERPPAVSVPPAPPPVLPAGASC